MSATSNYTDRPRHLQALQRRLANTRGLNGDQTHRLMRTMANVVVAQMLPAGAIKGGTSMNLRLGPDRSRFSSDIDVSRPRRLSEDAFIATLQGNLARGWSGFTGVVIKERRANPRDVPSQYVMQSYAIQVTYMGKVISRVPLELAMDEIESTEVAIETIDAAIVRLFTRIGLDEPLPCAVLSVEHQIAQKIHACTTVARGVTNQRAHDLVDIQLLYEDEELDLVALDGIGRRLFALRKKGTWPPEVRELPGWTSLYEEAAEGMGVRDLTQAVEWINELIGAAVVVANSQ